ncbi:MAG TPA: family 16 glycoside hydrolase, partial [Pseudolysinimonas sp.]|nr:family 16 glycoside hydrolase [Pseudolysinimonas sp.]
FTLGPRFDDSGKQVGLTEFGASRTPALVGFTPEKRAMLSYAAEASEFLSVWRFGEWNEIRVRCVGSLPVLTTWINGVRIAELDTATIERPNYNPEAVLAHLGPRGHLALEVHDRIPGAGDLFWGPGAVCRWRGIRIKEL